MFTVEIRINGSLKSHIYGRNLGESPEGKHRYTYEYYEVETSEVESGQVNHTREDGVIPLVTAILNDVSAKKDNV